MLKKTIGKKLESTKRTSITYRMTNGGFLHMHVKYIITPQKMDLNQQNQLPKIRKEIWYNIPIIYERDHLTTP